VLFLKIKDNQHKCTAGVYLLIRSSPLIEYSSTVLLICLWLGAITTVFSSLVGLFQQDIKKVIAYSTMSQLGMMVIAIGLSSYNLALFHLVNHAFYKGLLFLGAGAVIHAVGDNQDFRKYGGLIKYLPLTYSVILIASLSLVAIPFMTGFYSKDFILESAFGQYSYSSIAVYVIAVIGAVFTTLYSVKVLYLTFLANPNGSYNYYDTPHHAHEGDIFLSLPLVILAIFSIFFGYLTKDIFIGLGSSFFVDNSIFIHPIHEIMLDTEFAVLVLFKLLPLILTISFSILAIIYSEFLSESLINFKFSNLGYNIFGFFNQRFLIEMFYNKYITNLVLDLGGQTTKVLDKGSIEMLGPSGLQIGFTKLSKNIAILSTGIVTSYALYILMGMIIYLLITYLTQLSFSLELLFILIAFALIVVNFSLDSSYSKQDLDFKQLEANFFFGFFQNFKKFYYKYKNILVIVYLFYLVIKLFIMIFFPELFFINDLTTTHLADRNNSNDNTNVAEAKKRKDVDSEDDSEENHPKRSRIDDDFLFGSQDENINKDEEGDGDEEGDQDQGQDQDQEDRRSVASQESSHSFDQDLENKSDKWVQDHREASVRQREEARLGMMNARNEQTRKIYREDYRLYNKEVNRCAEEMKKRDEMRNDKFYNDDSDK